MITFIILNEVKQEINVLKIIKPIIKYITNKYGSKYLKTFKRKK